MPRKFLLYLFYTILTVSAILVLSEMFLPTFKPTHYFLRNSMLTCRIPQFDPFGKISMIYYKKETSKIKCKGFPSFIIANVGNYLSVNKLLLLENHLAEEKDLDCRYRGIRSDEKDRHKFTEWMPLKFYRPISEEFLYIECRKNGILILDDIVAFPPRKSISKYTKAESTSNQQDQAKLNVLLIGIDSISRLNSIRHLPKTRTFLESLNAIELRLYNKVGLNSFPNHLALLTGIKASNFDKDIYFDDVEFLWNIYSKEGYHTLFMEDMSEYASFNSYESKGFRKKPVDYYFRPVSTALDEFESKLFKNKFGCFRDKLILEFFWDYIKLFTRSGINPYFAYTFMASITHNALNSAGYLDEPASRLLQHLSITGELKNTVLFFFSDHGIRFSWHSIIGRQEANMPMAFLVLPDWFYHKYPNFYENLKTNQDRLTTPFDVHQTFKHMLSLSTNVSYIPNTFYGQSLFEAVPPSKTCEEAGIDPPWCSCHYYLFVNATESFVQKTAMAILNKINDLLKPVSRFCHLLELNEVLDSKARTVENKKHLLITIQTVPGNATFEAIGVYDTITKGIKIRNDISRTNSYKNTSMCVAHTKFVNYCICK